MFGGLLYVPFGFMLSTVRRKELFLGRCLHYISRLKKQNKINKRNQRLYFRIGETRLRREQEIPHKDNEIKLPGTAGAYDVHHDALVHAYTN